ncbi:MAG: hypothetical protein JNM27_20215 [Leptospirales bacterium]|nr:hypothetical protein [Leptospirales bacterium]
MGKATVVIFLCLSFAKVAEAREIKTSYDVELRAGQGLVCGTCKENVPWEPGPKVDLLLKSFFPLIPSSYGTIGPGLYGKVGSFDGITMASAGVLLGWDVGPFDLAGFAGAGYSRKRITDTIHGIRRFQGQTRHTYDLALTVGVPISEQFRLTATYGHNSNGSAIGINFLPDKGTNPGIDSLMLGVSYRFSK